MVWLSIVLKPVELFEVGLPCSDAQSKSATFQTVFFNQKLIAYLFAFVNALKNSSC